LVVYPLAPLLPHLSQFPELPLMGDEWPALVSGSDIMSTAMWMLYGGSGTGAEYEVCSEGREGGRRCDFVSRVRRYAVELKNSLRM